MEAYVVDWLSFLGRAFHLIAGIAWIGASFYFIWLDSHLRTPRYADEAQRLGIVSRLSESVVDDALAIAETLCGYGKFGLESTKQVLWANLEASSLEAALHVENRSQILASTSGEMLEAANAVLPRRQR